ncbi:threonine/serine exporter ThrE [Corynebacterium pelargi]|uniref:Uncharacterized protein n=1 Tax=Corynebacterium pelargi TaxID=1471400 RepID=A0A410W6T8_9CORY|nr:threonine/serine exporter family protein [Corynebacterium pelargi]QAU51673.1 hypothetical protein CPELA_01870 [Corynebacterium pelargi]GGG80404.1 hypothetical protein GCM10007338_18650 [Corynebacterium pelargi]
MSFADKLRALSNRSGRIATIDAVKAAPPPSPLAPIDLTDPVQVSAVMELAARVGEILLSSGTSNHDTKAQIHAITSAYGLYSAHVDITLNTITVFSVIGTTHKQPVTVLRVVRSMTTDFSKLIEVDRLIRSIQAGATPPDVAEKILSDITSRPASYGRGTSLLGWGTLGAAVSVMLGGNLLAAVLSFFLVVVVVAGSILLGKRRLPVFFQNAMGGFVATAPTAVVFALTSYLGIDFTPSHVVAGVIVVMLANLSLVQSIQDGITGAPVTASARFFETILLTGAIIGGVGAGIRFAEVVGISLPPLEAAVETSYVDFTVRVIAAAVAAGAFAVACFAEVSSVLVSVLTGGTGALIFYFVLMPLGISPVFGLSLSAAAIGLAGGLLARRFLVPPLITALSGIAWMLPGLPMYRAMYAALNDQTLLGFSNMAVALATACGLAAGVVFGEWVARKIRRPRKFHAYAAIRRTGRATRGLATAVIAPKRPAKATGKQPAKHAAPTPPRHARKQ